MPTSPENPPPTGIVETLEPGIRRILAPNPSPMTFWGTNSYIVGHGQVAVVDPGPDDDAHLSALHAALAPGERVSHILVTHSHVDHSPLAKRLSQRTGAPVLAFGHSRAGRSAVMEQLNARAPLSGGEGVDHDFAPDLLLGHGDIVKGTDWEITAHWTPGHFGNHLCFEYGDVLFSGDHVMGWASSMVSPPDGDLTQFMSSCEAMSEREDRVFFPGHGAPVHTPRQRVRDLLVHRRMRETQILDALHSAPDTASGLAERIYTDVPPALLPAATRNVLAHLIDLEGKNLIQAEGGIAADAIFRPL